MGQIVNLCLSHHDQLRSNAVQILFSMILTEYAQSGHINAIEYEIVNRLDSIFMSDSKGDDISRTFFIEHLRTLFEPAEVDAPLRDRVATFLDDVDMFLELLLSVRALPEGEEFADDRVIATVRDLCSPANLDQADTTAFFQLRLMNFIRRIGRDEIYIKYVHQLVNVCGQICRHPSREANPPTSRCTFSRKTMWKQLSPSSYTRISTSGIFIPIYPRWRS